MSTHKRQKRVLEDGSANNTKTDQGKNVEGSGMTYPYCPIILKPVVFCAELHSNGSPKFCVCITHSFNTKISRWISGTGPLWIRKFPFKAIVEIDVQANYITLRDMTIRLMTSHGHENVRSSMPGHRCDLATIPSFFFQ